MAVLRENIIVTLVLKINYPRFAAKNKTEMTLFKLICASIYLQIQTNVYLFSFLYCDELVCSHLDGIFVK